jgi:hypothetical protein
MKGDNIMLNKEKYAKEILDIVCQDGENPAIINNTPTKCDDNVQCSKCKLYYYGSCARGFAEWANSEYKEHEIDWNKVPVDTCILITDSYGNSIKRHFAKYYNKTICAYPDGKTSWSFNQDSNQLIDWDEKNVQIEEGVDCSEWYKD